MPGVEIYRQQEDSFIVSVREVEGSEEKLFCQNLSLIAKLFLDHKSVYYDVTPFKFYVLYEIATKSTLCAYFSKDFGGVTEYNLSCIMTLPCFQRKGYGQFLISLSYFMSRKEGRVSTPEVPLTDLGLLSYKSYWTRTIFTLLIKSKGNYSISEISEKTGIQQADIISTLQDYKLVKI